MAPISSISGTQSAVQSSVQQLALQQARNDADRAEQKARSLQAQAASAQQVADRAQQNARFISGQADQAQANAGQARQRVAVVKTIGEMQTRLENAVGQVTEKLQAAESGRGSTSSVLNTQGQVTGAVINTTA